jgi:hypothetical protein
MKKIRPKANACDPWISDEEAAERIERARAIRAAHGGACEIQLGHKGEIVGWTRTRLARWRKTQHSPWRPEREREERVFASPLTTRESWT